MPRFRKKPVVIEAERWNPELDLTGAGRVAEWMQRNGVNSHVNVNHAVSITTLEGVMVADVGDWIIKGVKGEFYPCKPDIFEATYEKVE